MPKDRRKHNKDYYNVAGTDPGAAAPTTDAREAMAQERALLHRGEEHRLPGEAPRPGTPRAERAERPHREPSVLDRLPRPVGAAGIPASQKPAGGEVP